LLIDGEIVTDSKHLLANSIPERHCGNDIYVLPSFITDSEMKHESSLFNDDLRIKQDISIASFVHSPHLLNFLPGSNLLGPSDCSGSGSSPITYLSKSSFVVVCVSHFPHKILAIKSEFRSSGFFSLMMVVVPAPAECCQRLDICILYHDQAHGFPRILQRDPEANRRR
jgi:hypothetical protein